MATLIEVIPPIELVLPQWHELINKWALDGSLKKAVESSVARDLKDPELKELEELLIQWSDGNYKSLPPVSLEAKGFINERPVVYDRLQNKIIINQDWAYKVDSGSILNALTQGLGNYLDNTLNNVESPENEGELLAKSLLGTSELPQSFTQATSATAPSNSLDLGNLAISSATGPLPKEVIVKPIDDIIIPGEYITISVSPASVPEDSTNALIYTFSRSSIAIDPLVAEFPVDVASYLTVYYNVDGSATLGIDYEGLPGPDERKFVTFAPGVSSVSIEVVPIADSLRELDESAVLSLVPGSGYNIGTPSKAVGIIRNDEKLFCTPFELLFLQDLSGSYWDDLPVVRKLLPSIIAEVNSLQPNTPIGISSFIDKPIAPFGIYPDYVYKTDQSLTTNAAVIQTVYDNLVIGSGYDAPESQLEALLQVALRPSEIGFSAGSKRVVILFTDAAYHIAGDGAAAGITIPNNLDAILDGSPAGTGEDYPGLVALRQQLIDANLLPIFAVTPDQLSTYQSLLAQLAVGGSVVELTSDSSNIVQAIREGLLNLFVVNINSPAGGLITSECGGTASFRVSLCVRPSADVVISLAPFDTTEGSLSTYQLVFTPSNWNIPQIVTVTGIDDPESPTLIDGDQTYQIITGAIVSADPNFNGINPVDIAVTNKDCDYPIVSVAVSPASVLEDGPDKLRFKFTRSDASSPLTVSFAASGTATPGLDYTGLIGGPSHTISFATGDTSVFIDIDPTADSFSEFDETVVLTLTPGSGYIIGSPGSAVGVIKNDDKLFCGRFELLFLQDLSGSFGDDITIVRDLIPDIIADVNALQPNTPIGVSSFIDKPITPFGVLPDYVYKTDQSLTTNAAVIQTVYDNLVIGSGYDAPESQLEALLQVALRPSEIGFSAGSKRVVILFTDAAYHIAGDGAAAGITIPNNLDAILDGSPAGTGEDYPGLVALRQQLIDANLLPIFAVTPDQLSTYQSLLAQLAVGGSVVELTSDSSNIVQAIREGLLNLFVVNINSPAGGLITSECGGTASFRVSLCVRPSADVVISLAPFDTTEGSLSTYQLVFTPSNWNIPQIVTVTGIDDPESPTLIDGDQTYQIITGAIVSADPNFNGINPVDIAVTNKDCDFPIVSVAVSPASVLEDGPDNLRFKFTRSDASSPLTVSFAASGTATPGLDYTGLIGGPSHTISFATGDTSVFIDIDPTADTSIEPDETVVITLTPGSDYTIGTSSSAVGLIKNDDFPPIIKEITVVGTQLQVDFSEPIVTTGLTVSRFSATVAGLARGVTAWVPVLGDPTRLLLTLAGTAPTSAQSVSLLYTDLPGDNTTGIIQDVDGNDMETIAAPGRNAETYSSAINVTTLATSYTNLLLTGNAITGTANKGNNLIRVNQISTVANVLIGAEGVDSMDGGNGSDIYLITSATHHSDSEVRDTGTGASDSDELRFASVTAGETLTVYSGDIGLERITIGTGTASTAILTGTTALHIDASAAVNPLTITGNSGDNKLIATAFNDTILGGDGLDAMNGGDGSDLYVIQSSLHHNAAEISDSGSTGTDELRFSSVTASQTLAIFAGDTGLERVVIGTGTSTSPILSGTTNLNINAVNAPNRLAIIGNNGANFLEGTSFGDILTGNGGADSLLGNAGNDTIDGGDGIDKMDGGDGSDLYIIFSNLQHSAAEISDSGLTGTDELRFASTTANQTLTIFSSDKGLEIVSIGTGSASAPDITATTALNVNAAAAPNALQISGNNGANSLTGSTFADNISGNTGNDSLNGGLGNDTLIGGAGADVFRFDSILNPSSNVDRIIDFSIAENDRVQLENAVFTALITVGGLAASAFRNSTFSSASTTAQRILYNSLTGDLLYDPDGTNPLAPTLFAKLDAALALTSGQFTVT
jgi:Ca2+-binding RTX toxin-like protein